MAADYKAIGSLSSRTTALAEGWQPEKQYDAILAAVSWETRATAALELAGVNSETVTVLRFASSDQAIVDAKAAQLNIFQTRFGAKQVLDLENSTRTDENIKLLQAWIFELYRQKKRPIRLLVDISCIPKTYVMFLIGLGFSLDVLTCLDCLYTAGSYNLYGQDTATVSGPRSLVSIGDWSTHQIPYLNSSVYMRGQKDVYVALGGEIALALPFIEKLEPSRLRVAFISDTEPSSPDQYLTSERVAYEELLHAPNFSRASFALSEGVDLAADLLSFARDSASEGVTALAIGCKTHAAGMALASLAERRIEVVTRVPNAYKSADVRPAGPFYLLEIHDRFDPHSYL